MRIGKFVSLGGGVPPGTHKAQAPSKAHPWRCWKQSEITYKGRGPLGDARSRTPAGETPLRNPPALPPQDGACCTGPAGSLQGKEKTSLCRASAPRTGVRAAAPSGRRGARLGQDPSPDKDRTRLCRAGPPPPRRLPSAQNQLTPSTRPPAKGEAQSAGANRRQSLINEHLLQ